MYHSELYNQGTAQVLDKKNSEDSMRIFQHALKHLKTRSK